MHPFLLALLTLQIPLFAAPAENAPNFIFFIADDVSQEDFGCYGHPSIQTPNVDALAANGMRFDNAYLTTSSCSPSRCSIITGRYPHNTGAPELHSKLPDSQTRFPELLRQAGYYTALSGKNHMFGNKDRAFDLITQGGGPGKEDDWVQIVNDRPSDRPFFFWFASSDAHRVWQKSEHAPEYALEEVVVPPFLIDSETTRQDLADYYHEVSRFDHFIGLVVAKLKEQDVFENTVIVVAADNGRPFPRCKSRLYDSGIKTPWVVSYPELIRNASTTNSLVSSIDLSATLLELAGLEKPETIQGQSFLPILRDPQARTRDMVFSEHNWHVYKNHERMVRFGDYLYIKNNYPDQPNLCSEAFSPPSGKDLWEAHAKGKTNTFQQQVFANPCPEEELYRVTDEPHQFTNLASNPEHAQALTKARQLISDWSTQTGDSIPTNPTPHRSPPPFIEDGKIVFPKPDKKGPRNPHAEFPGQSNNATQINQPGPIRFPK
ncbi:sulfatase family protein [Pelagicoccus mobilis]|uniref:Sulfatase n=1 Tax=Pelagicoccus mobilis TaxID=415221 RepID=A0A934S182_9BACT|nr:sulfatase [Pelagicoccus mobilis]MBK1877584.1 sulfatase [Pelagicoccus mobilis]